MPQAAPVPAAENFDLMRMAMRFDRVTARSMVGSSMSSQWAAATTGIVAVMP